MVRWKLNGEFRMQLSIIWTVCGGVLPVSFWWAEWHGMACHSSPPWFLKFSVPLS